MEEKKCSNKFGIPGKEGTATVLIYFTKFLM